MEVLDADLEFLGIPLRRFSFSLWNRPTHSVEKRTARSYRHRPPMRTLKVKYVLWAADMDRAIRFYCDLFGGELSFRTDVWSEVVVCGATIGLHGDGEGKRTWTGLSFQVDDLREGVSRLVACGGELTRPLEESSEEELHLALCVDPEGNEFMMTQPRQH